MFKDSNRNMEEMECQWPILIWTRSSVKLILQRVKKLLDNVFAVLANMKFTTEINLAFATASGARLDLVCAQSNCTGSKAAATRSSAKKISRFSKAMESSDLQNASNVAVLFTKDQKVHLSKPSTQDTSMVIYLDKEEKQTSCRSTCNQQSTSTMRTECGTGMMDSPSSQVSLRTILWTMMEHQKLRIEKGKSEFSISSMILFPWYILNWRWIHEQHK